MASRWSLLAVQFVAAIGAVVASPKSPLHVTTSHITTLIVPASPCYTKTIHTPYYGENCPALTDCLPSSQCLALLTTTIPVPPSNPLCASTTTTVAPGPCRTCVNNCLVRTSTFYQTVDSWPAPTLAPVARDVACATTVWKSATVQKGLTYTYHSLTQTRISLVDCKGCSLIVSEMQGAGPGVTRTTTVTDTKPEIVTSYTCQ